MPNWCDNSIVIEGEKNELDILYQRMLNAKRSSANSDAYWTYELFIQHGYKREEILSSSFPYVGGTLDQVEPPEKEGDTFIIRLWITTRWSPMLEGFKKIINDYQSLKLYYVAEECGESIYLNTDTEGKYFTDKYCIYDDDTGSEYFDSDDSFIKYMKDTYNKDISLVSELKDDDEIKIKRGKCINFHRFVAY